MTQKLKTILFVALPGELPIEVIPPGVEIIYTGVGKINAAISAVITLKDLDPKTTRVVNFGSAGSLLPKMQLYQCTYFSQHDMNAEPLAPSHHTPFDDLFYKGRTDTLRFGENGHICATQDSFEKNPQDIFIYDMEAYALAKVCKKMGFQFHCFKFVSDGGEAEDWKENHGKVIDLFVDVLNKLLYNQTPNAKQ